MRTFVMGDIHGMHKALVQCLDRCGFNKETDQLIQLGDVTDRGPEVFECVETLLKIKNLVVLKSNHDEWFHNFITTGLHPENWAHGGRATILSYQRHVAPFSQTAWGNTSRATPVFLPADVPASHISFFNSQLFYFIDSQNNCFVHGGFDPRAAFDSQHKNDLLNNRKLWNEAMSFAVLNEASVNLPMATPFHEIFIGHTPTTHWHTDQPMQAANVWNMDTGAGRNGRLTIMDVETKAYWPSDPIAELYR